MTEEAHQARTRKAEARDLVTSWVLALWALGTGIYLTGGGVKHLMSPAYTYVRYLFGGDYHTVATLLLIAGTVVAVGVFAVNDTIISIGCVLVGLWLLMVGVLMCAASINVPDGGNLNWTTSIGFGIIYLIRAYNKINPPNIQGVAAMLALSLMIIP